MQLSTGKSPQATRKKLIVAGLLGVLLVVVLMIPSGNSENASSETGEAPSSPHSVGANTAQSAGNLSAATDTEIAVTHLPPVNLQRVLAHNPFRNEPAASDQLVHPEVTDREEAPADDDPLSQPEIVIATTEQAEAHTAALPALLELNITGIVTGGARPAALIGKRLFYENDELEGWRIVSIRPQSIVVTPPHPLGPVPVVKGLDD